jgi:AAT family amino acid transporter
MDNKDSQSNSGYKRTLTNTHIQVIALGGTIGTGLFLGVGESIRCFPFLVNAGPRRINSF